MRDSSTIKLDEQLRQLMPYVTQMQHCPYKNDSTHALLLTRIGALYFLQGDYYQGIKLLKQAKDMIYQNNGKSNINPALLVRIYNNLRICYDALGQKNLKWAAIDSCIAVSVRLKKEYGISLGMMYYKTVSYIENGDYYRCISYADFAENVAKNGGYNLDIQTEFATWKINALVLLKQYDAAERLAKDYMKACFKVSAFRNVGALYGLLATVKKETGNKDEALKFYRLSLQYYQRAGNVSGCAATLNNTGDLYLKEFGKSDDALAYYRQALEYAILSKLQDNNVGESMNVLNSIAGVYIKKRMFDSAFAYFQKSFDEIHPAVSETELAKNSDKYLNAELADYVSNLVLNKADAYLLQFELYGDVKKLAQAVSTYKAIDRIFDRIKFGQADVEAKLFWRSQTRRLYENAIKACYLQNNTADALYFFEKSRAVLLQDQLNEQKMLTADQVMQQTQIRRVVNMIEQDIGEAAPGNNRDSLQQELLRRKQQLDSLGAVIRENNRFYYQSVVDTNMLRLEEVSQRILEDHDALIEIFAGDSAVYILNMIRGNTQLKRILKVDYDNLSSSFVHFLSNPELANKEYDQFVSTSNRLYQLIFSNLTVPKGRIIISPDGKYFPFEALLSSQGSEHPAFFVEDHAVSYTYSARYLMNSFDKNIIASARNFMGVAPVKFSASFGLPMLLGSDRSLSNVQSHFDKADRWIKSSATRANFLHNYHRYKIIQLYTHATDSGFNKEPVIYFADSALLLSDLLYENKPATDLIVLSACETGAGRLYEGEGVFSFNRGFAAVGIPSSVANLWEVENSSTYKLTELFYEFLSKEMPVDIALQKAKIEFIKTASPEKQLPYYWAAPILTGRTDAIHLRKNHTWMYIAVGALLGCITLIFALRRKSIHSDSKVV